MMNESVSSIMSRDLITVRPENNLARVRALFLSHQIHHLPVVKGKKMVGILTTYDLWKNAVSPDDYHTTLVSEIMTKKVAKILPNDKIGTAAEVFLDNRFHALPVVNEEDELLGIVTSFDVLLYNFKKEYPNPILFTHLFELTPQMQVAQLD